MIVAIVLVVIGVIVIAGAVMMRRRAREPVAVARGGASASTPFDNADGLVAFGDGVHGDEPPMGATVASGERAGGGAVGNVPEPTWPQRVQRNAGALDRDARLRLIGDLGLLRATWCVPILEQAVGEETDAELRDAATAALAKCGGRAMRVGETAGVSRNGSAKGEERSPSV